METKVTIEDYISVPIQGADEIIIKRVSSKRVSRHPMSQDGSIPRMEKTKFLCDERCNGCEATENRQAALLMNVLREVYGDGVVQIANSICPNMTCCPDCRIDDFCHMGDDDGRGICEIEAEARRIARRFRHSITEEEVLWTSKT